MHSEDKPDSEDIQIVLHSRQKFRAIYLVLDVYAMYSEAEVRVQNDRVIIKYFFFAFNKNIRAIYQLLHATFFYITCSGVWNIINNRYSQDRSYNKFNHILTGSI